MNANEVSALIGDRVRQYRLNQDLTQYDLASIAGVSLRAVKNAEAGKSTLVTYTAIMIAMGRIDHFLAAFPDEGVSPVQLLKSRTNSRKRASGKRQVRDPEPRGLDW